MSKHYNTSTVYNSDPSSTTKLSYQDIQNTHLREAAKNLLRALKHLQHNTFANLYYGNEGFKDYC